MSDALTINGLSWLTLKSRLARYLPRDLFKQLCLFPENLEQLGEKVDPQIADQLQETIRTLEPLHRVLIHYMPRYLLDLDPSPGEPHGEILTGSFIHADLKGFTALTELLARQGQEQGQEAMNRMLNRLFSGLLDPLTASGGDLLIFAGDAVLAYFPKQADNEDVLKATRAALRMERAILPFSTIENEFGQCHLTMRIGIEQGLAYAGVVGTKQRMELLVSGPGIDQAMLAEGQAQPGQVRLGPQAAKLAGPHFTMDGATVVDDLGQTLGDYEVRLPKRRRARSVVMSTDISELLTALDVTLKRVERLAPFLPEDLLAGLVNTDRRRKLDMEFRPVAVQFINLLGLEELALKRGVEIATTVFQRYFVRAQEVVNQHEGVVSQIDAYPGGFFLLNTFGTPKVHEGITRYSVSAALQLAQVLADLNREFALDPPLKQRGGITYGRTFNGEIGANYRREAVIAGPSVNRASRLMSQAAPGQVILDGDIWSQTQEAFIGEHLSPVSLKGIDGPVVIVNVSDVRWGTQLSLPKQPLLGREIEQTYLLKALASLSKEGASHINWINRPNRAWLISGETGIGKTTLVSSVAHQAKKQAIKVLVGRCQPHSKNVPLFPWLDLLIGWLGLDEHPDKDDQYNHLKTILTDLNLSSFIDPLTDLLLENFLTEPVNHSQIIFSLLQKLTDREPLLIILEDIHWIDQESLAVVNDCLSQLITSNLMLCLTRREVTILNSNETEKLEMGKLESLPLSPLSDEALVGVVQRVLGAASLEDILVQWAIKWTGGNPLYAETLCRALQQSDAIILAQQTGEARWTGLEPVVPLLLHELLLARFDALSHIQQEVLKRGAVMGITFEYEGILQLDKTKLSPQEIEIVLEETVQAAFLTKLPGGKYAFSHPLMQEAIYATLSFSQRRDWHTQIGHWLLDYKAEQNQVLELLAYHYLRGTDPDKGARFGRKAGDRARERGAYIESLEYYQQVIALPNAPREEKAKAEEGWTRVLTLQSKPEAAKE